MGDAVPCLGQRDHDVASGTNFCHRCGLIVGPRRKRKAAAKQRVPLPRIRRRARARGLPGAVRDLVDCYGFARVEQALYEVPDDA